MSTTDQMNIYELFSTRYGYLLTCMLKNTCYDDIDYDKLFFAACLSVSATNLILALEMGANPDAIPYHKSLKDINTPYSCFSMYESIYKIQIDENTILHDYIMYYLSQRNSSECIKIIDILHVHNYKFDTGKLVYLSYIDYTVYRHELIDHILSRSCVTDEIFEQLFIKFNDLLDQRCIKVILKYGTPNIKILIDGIKSMSTSRYRFNETTLLLKHYNEKFDLSMAVNDIAHLINNAQTLDVYDTCRTIFEIGKKYNMNLDKYYTNVLTCALHRNNDKVISFIRDNYDVSKIIELIHLRIINSQ
jgi:hypothetical protein